MGTEHLHPIYSRNSTVHIVTPKQGMDKHATFAAAMEQSGFIQHLLDHWEKSKGGDGKPIPKEQFAIAIKPNIMTASESLADSPVYTDPALVEQLIAAIRAQGFAAIAVVEAQNVYNYSYQRRTVQNVAREICGYTGNGYSIVDLSQETVPFDYGGRLGHGPAGKIWHDADYRISFAKNKSHWQCFFTGCIKNVYGCLPQWDKMRHYHGRGIEFYESAVLIAERLPIHFGFLDACVSGDGLTGHVRDGNPNRTETFFASDNIFALDWTANEKMEINPAHNYVLQEAMHRWGTIQITRIGDLTPWTPWGNVRPFVVVAMNAMEEFYWLSRFMSRAMASGMDKRFTPVSRWQWFFGILQTITGWLSRLGEKKAPSPNNARRVPA